MCGLLQVRLPVWYLYFKSLKFSFIAVSVTKKYYLLLLFTSFKMSLSAFASIKVLTTSEWPSYDAICNGVHPYCTYIRIHGTNHIEMY